MFITLEGGEGAGKSTQARMLAERIAATGRAVLQTREPGGAPGAEILRAMLLAHTADWSPSAETLLHFAARFEHLHRTILPALAAGTIVVCDRFADSTMAYQGWGQGGDRALIAALTRLLPVQPALTLLLRIDRSTADSRLSTRGGPFDRYEREDWSFHARVTAGFEAIAAAEPDRVQVINGIGMPATVHDRIWSAVEPRLP